ncbi:related to IMP2-mitochondrial inner membrane protease subunit [Rhynchosporium agropyri]|uniref:Mitochondrial inner membrane protease subunit 2 n=1 Tax=Rhynchosporium agropyri TaxID=914238 RepID=A0A1E1K1K4_9HELO|nr:related to IMP2-mitochondrial inner membrane protease subunit [Rhynchosporium agropyri]
MSIGRMFPHFNRKLQWRPTWRELSFWPIRLLPWIPAIIFSNDHVIDVVWINGPSMYPFLNPSFNENLSKDVCLNYKWNPRKNLGRGMIISYQSPAHPEVQVVKRIIAMEGDLVTTRAPCPVPTVRVPANHVWVEGDNEDSGKTLDSNTFGPIPLNLISGKLTYVLGPWKRFGRIHWEDYEGNSRVVKGSLDDLSGWD